MQGIKNKCSSSSKKVKATPQARTSRRPGLRKKPSKKKLSGNWIKFCDSLISEKEGETSDDEFYFLPAYNAPVLNNTKD